MRACLECSQPPCASDVQRPVCNSLTASRCPSARPWTCCERATQCACQGACRLRRLVALVCILWQGGSRLPPAALSAPAPPATTRKRPRSEAEDASAGAAPAADGAVQMLRSRSARRKSAKRARARATHQAPADGGAAAGAAAAAPKVSQPAARVANAGPVATRPAAAARAPAAAPSSSSSSEERDSSSDEESSSSEEESSDEEDTIGGAAAKAPPPTARPWWMPAQQSGGDGIDAFSTWAAGEQRQPAPSAGVASQAPPRVGDVIAYRLVEMSLAGCESASFAAQDAALLTRCIRPATVHRVCRLFGAAW